MVDKIQAGRLAFREEGQFWNVYYAPPDTMEGAILLGALKMSLARNPRTKQAFMGTMRAAFGDVIAEVAGVRPTWGAPEAAPEHERAGNG